MRIDSNLVGQARKADMIAFMEKRYGYEFIQRGNGYRCKQHPSLGVNLDRVSWFWHSKGVGGFGVLVFLMKMENMGFKEAMDAASSVPVAPAPAVSHKADEQERQFILPEKAGLFSFRVFDYLNKKRGIHGMIIDSLMREGKLYEDKNGNCVFVGFDESGKPRYASVRGTRGSFHMDCAGSSKRYGFSMAAPSSERLYIFESAIDLLSHASLAIMDTGYDGAWAKDNRLSLAGVTGAALPFFLHQHPSVKELVFCLDNDQAGREAADALARKYADEGYNTRTELPDSKDCNEDLLVRLRQARTMIKHKSMDGPSL
jgi:hypothetical protein